MLGTNVEMRGSDDECSTDESIFDDAVEESQRNAAAIGQADQKDDQNYKKRKGKSRRNKFWDLLQAVKRRRIRQEEFERQLDPDRFDDSEDPIQHSSALIVDAPRKRASTEVGRGFQRTRKKKTTSVNSTATTASSATAISFRGANTVDDQEEINSAGDAPDSVATYRDNNDADGGLFPHQNRDTNRNKDPEDRNLTSSNYFKFDEQKFFSLPTFRPEIKEEAFRRIYAAIETPLKALEEEGYEAYRQYIEDGDVENSYDDRDNNDAGSRFREKKRKSSRGVFRKLKANKSHRKRERMKEESIRNSLRNAIVNGDPREYQRKIFEVAKQRNTIVNLGTGAGKTLIALLLIREVWSAQSSSPSNGTSMGDGAKNKSLDGEKKQTLFLVPSVALAIQQSLTLRANLPHLNVQTAVYANSRSRRRRTTLSKCNVIVATHGVIQDLLMHYGDMFRMDRFNLVVIDECHYASSGNHAYRNLMKKFYHPLELEKRPRVLGLTASPLLNVKESHDDKQLSSMLDNLERTLDSKMVSAVGLITTHDGDDTQTGSIGSVNTGSDTSGFLHRVIREQTFNYRGKNMIRTIPIADNLDLLPSRYREFKQLEQLYKDLGPLVLMIYCTVLRRELSKNIFENESTLQFDCAVSHLKRIEEFCSQETKYLPHMGRNDKMLALEELIETLIEEQGGAKTIGLVFVERRITAIALQCYFLWRNQQILDESSANTSSDWKFAKKARRQKLKSDSYFQLKISENKGDQGDDEDDQFDDSIDDPFRVFEQRNKPQNEVSVTAGFQGEIKEASNDISQFMDADSDSDEVDDGAEGSSKKGLFHGLGECSNLVLRSAISKLCCRDLTHFKTSRSCRRKARSIGEESCSDFQFFECDAKKVERIGQRRSN